MLILTIRTDKPQAEIGLFNNANKVDYVVWQAHRQLAETIHQKLEALLTNNNKQWKDIEGIGVYQGPGSFTGLRIGLSVANALAYSLQIPIVGATGEDWLNQTQESLAGGKDQKQVLPEYGADVHITQQKK